MDKSIVIKFKYNDLPDPCNSHFLIKEIDGKKQRKQISKVMKKCFLDSGRSSFSFNIVCDKF